MNYLLIFAMVVVGFGPILVEMARGKFEMFNLKNLFILYFVIQLGISALPTLLSNQASEIGLDPDRYASAYTAALVVATLGLLVFQCAYYLGARSKVQLPRLLRSTWRKDRYAIVAWCYLALGYFSFFVLLQTNGGFTQFLANREEFRGGGMVGQGYLLFPATSLVNIGTLVYFLGGLQGKVARRHIAKSWAMLVLSLVPAFFLGFRSALLLPLLQFMVAWHFGYRALPMKSISALLVTIGVLFTIYGLNRELPPGIEFSLRAVGDVVAENPELAYAVISRSKGTEVVSAVIKKLDETGNYELGWRGLLETVTIVIPKAIWADKPQPSSQRFTTYFFASDLAFSRGYEMDAWGGISPTVVGELYWHFGLTGVLLGLFLFGRAARTCFAVLKQHMHNPCVIATYSILFTFFVMSAEAIQGYLNLFVMNTPVLLFTWWVLTVRLRPAAARSRQAGPALPNP